MPLFSSCGAEKGQRVSPGAASPRPCLPLSFTRARDGWHSWSSDCPPTPPYPGLRCAASPSRSSPSPAGLVCAARRWPGWHCGPAGKSVPLPVSGRCRALLQRHTSWGHGEHREPGGGCVPRVCTGSVRLSFGNRQACYLRARPPSSSVLNIFHVLAGGLNALQELIHSVFSTTWSVFN